MLLVSCGYIIIFIRICIEVVKLILTEFLIFTHMVHFMALNKLFF